jgi:hypothetical protein
VQFLNVLGCEFVIRLSLFAEWIGVCHFSWLLYYGAANLMCSKVKKIQKEIDANPLHEDEKTSDTAVADDPMSPTEKIRGPDFDAGNKGGESDEFTWFDYPRFVWSTIATLGALVVIIYGIGGGYYVLPVPVVAAYTVAVFTMSCLFYLEGLMIAIVGTQYWDPEQFREAYPRAYEMHKFVNQPDNVKRFIIGRQFFTVLTNFLLAQIFTFKVQFTDLRGSALLCGPRSGVSRSIINQPPNKELERPTISSSSWPKPSMRSTSTNAKQP